MIFDKGLRRLRRILLAPATVIILISLVIIFCATSVLVPQTLYRGPGYYERLSTAHPDLAWFIATAGLDHIFGSIWFLAVMSLTALALSLTVADQFGRLMRIKRPAGGGMPVKPCGIAATFHADSMQGLSEISFCIRTFLKDKGYRIIEFNKGKDRLSTVASKGRSGRWGMAIFHLGLLVVVLSGLWGMVFYSRGLAQVMLGETIQGHPSDWLFHDGGLLARELDTDFTMRLDEMKVDYWPDGRKRHIESRITVKTKDRPEISLPLSVSTPIDYNGFTIYQGLDFGYAVTVAMKRAGARTLFTNFLLEQPASKTTLKGRMDFPSTPYIFSMKLHPDSQRPSHILNNPVVDLTVLKDDIIRFSGRVPVGNGIMVDGNEVYIADVRYWAGIIVVTGYAIKGVYIGFIAALLGLFLHYFIIPRRISLDLQQIEPVGYKISLIGEPCLPISDIQADFAKIINGLNKKFCIREA